MSFKTIVLKQHQNKVNQAARQFGGSLPPAGGWLRTVRQALGMSGSQLARRLGVTRGRISQAEAAEQTGGVTLKTMKSMAEAMNCRFVYAIVPAKEVGLVIKERALKKAKQRVQAATVQMALEAQALAQEKLDIEIERIARELADTMPADLWNDE